MAKVSRDGKGRWRKGQSGNPSGSTSEEMQARIQAMRALAGMVPEATDRLLQLITSEDEKVSLGAIKVVLEHVVGKERVAADVQMPTAIIIDGYEIRPREKPEQAEATA